MAARYQQELRRPAGSPRPKGRENTKETLCRNVTIYGHCRYEDQGCAFNHDPSKMSLSAQPEPKHTGRLNVDSPAFTPTALPARSGSTISTQAAAAAPFTPRQSAGIVNSSIPSETEPITSFNPRNIRDFTPSQATSANGIMADAPQTQLDPFHTMDTVSQALPPAQYNPYLADNHSMANSGGAYYQSQTTYPVQQHPLQYHLYAPTGPHRSDLQPYQRQTHDFFMPEKLREELQKKAEATLQVMPNSTLPIVEHYHTLVNLYTSNSKSATVFGYPSWVYKATSSKNGKTYCLRRLEGYRVTDGNSFQSVKEWKKIDNASVVSVRDVITTRAFGDSSLIIITDYFPLSKTLVEQHITTTNRFGSRGPTGLSEELLWSYMVQIASAIKTIHAANLAVRCMNPSKVIVTEKSRIRLNACAIMDVVQFDTERRSVSALQQEDFILFGRLILAVATSNASPNILTESALEQLSRNFSSELTEAVEWLVTPKASGESKSITEFLVGIAGQVVCSLDRSLHSMDTRTSELSRELENGRLFRMAAKLGTINERPEFDVDKAWSETGERYMLKLFRDYTFHQVDEQGRPVVDLGHIIRCLNNLDVGTEEKVRLTSRDEETSFVVTYKELKKQVNAAWSDLQKWPKGRY